MTCYYFYLYDDDFGPAFIKVCTYFPYPVKVWLNGHEWSKRQAAKAGIEFTELSNGFGSCADPAALQAICDRLGPGEIGVFFERWMSRLPLPLTEHDREGGYWWELSMRQIETSRTLVFDAPRRARSFFEALVADNLDIGRPDNVELIFHGPRHLGRPVKLDCTQDQDRHPRHRGHRQRLLQKLPHQTVFEGRPRAADRDRDQLTRRPALPAPTGPSRRAAIQGPCGQHRLLDTERVGQGCVLASPAFERIARPTLTEDGRRAPALRFGDPRVQALAGALCTTMLAVTGITNKSLRALMTGLLGGTAYTTNRASYDLARLRVNGLIDRIPGRNHYRLTSDGLRFAIFYTKVHDRLLRPLLAADQPPAPQPLRNALHTIDIHITETIDRRRLLPNAA